MAARQPAPGRLRLVEDFVNTREEDDDAITTPAALAAWLAERGLLRGGARATQDDLRRAREVREALRALLRANNGSPPDDAAIRTLNEFADRARYVLRFSPEGEATLAPGAGGVDGALAEILHIVHHAMADGTWPRLKACRMDTCGWAFWDSSRNQSAAWCSMRVCGNRAKARAYRERRGAGA
ncbi:MAG TPA: CGNR zinc finger domain-containing protein [Dehalococcoidia bacterium]|nr:CGNR zinc finger domain-containing protein [Dehalococcoidia bacterium]